MKPYYMNNYQSGVWNKVAVESWSEEKTVHAQKTGDKVRKVELEINL